MEGTEVSLLFKKLLLLQLLYFFLLSLSGIHLALGRMNGKEENLYFLYMPDTAEQNHITYFICLLHSFHVNFLQ